MQDRPNQAELIESVRRFIEEEIVPAIADRRLKFRSRVAAHVLSVAARERELEGRLLEAEQSRLAALLPHAASRTADLPLRERVEALNVELASSIRSGTIVAAPGNSLWDHLRLTAREKLEIANPGKLRGL